MTNQLKPANQPDRIVIELDVPTIKRMCHALGAHCPFNECFKDILYLTKVCEDAEEKYAESVREKAAAEAKGNTIREYLTEQAAKKIRDDLKLDAEREAKAAASPQIVDEPEATEAPPKIDKERVDSLNRDLAKARDAKPKPEAVDTIPMPKPKPKAKPEHKRQFLQYGDKPS